MKNDCDTQKVNRDAWRDVARTHTQREKRKSVGTGGEDRVVAEDGLRISRHPHHPTDPCELRDCSPPFVAPASFYIPIEVVSVRIEEHQHRERTPSGFVLSTGSHRDAGVILGENERMKQFSTEA